MIYEKIVKMCAEKGISIYFLERTLHFGNGTIKGWKTTNPRVDLLKKVCDYFSITLDEMMTEESQ